MENKKTHVLIINNLVQFYGAEQSLYVMAKNLKAVRPIVCVSQKGPLPDRLKEDNVDVEYFDFKSPEFHDDYGEKLESRINEILKKHAIDIVHLNKPYLSDADFVITMRRITRERNIPMIVHIRSNEILYDEQDMELLLEMDKWIFVSNKCKEEFFSINFSSAQDLKFPVTKVIYNARPLSEYEFCRVTRKEQRERLNIREDDFIIGMIGYFRPCKGQKKLVELAKRFKSDDRIKFLMIGGLIKGDTEEYRQGVLDLIKENQLEEKVLLTGYRDAKNLLSTLDVVISLSETEGLPGVIIEAMANGRAIIANPVGGIPEMIGDNGAGYCIRHDDIDDAEHQIRKYMDDRTLLKKQGEMARKRAFELFDHRNHTQEIEELYMNLMMNRNKDCVGV